MLKQMTALLLALCMALSLAGCKKKVPVSEGTSSVVDVVGKEYASSHAMDVFETWEAIRNLKDKRFLMQISGVDSQTGDAGHEILRLEGNSFASLHQAVIQVTLEELPLTTIYVKENMLLLDVKTAAETLSEKYLQLNTLDEEDKEGFREDLMKIAEDIPTDYAVFELAEDPWTSSESGAFSASREILKKVYESVKSSVSSKVKAEQDNCTLVLGAGDLQEQLLKLTGSLAGDKDVYEQSVIKTLNGCFEDVLIAYGMDAEDWFATKWEKYEELDEELNELEASGIWKEWTVKAVTCGDEENGYTFDLVDRRDTPRDYCLSVYPAEAVELSELPEATASAEIADELAELYSYGEIFRDLRKQSVVSDDEKYENELSPSDLKDNQPTDEQFMISTSEKYQQIGYADFYTEDGKKVVVPVPLNYDEVEAERDGSAVVDIFLNNNGYVLEYSSVSARDIRKQVKDNMDIYEETFRDEYEYSITQIGDVKTSADGSTAIGGIGYYDEDLEQDVTILTASTAVKGSEYSVCLDVFVYSRSVTDQDLSALNELLDALNVECPLTITKN